MSKLGGYLKYGRRIFMLKFKKKLSMGYQNKKPLKRGITLKQGYLRRQSYLLEIWLTSVG
jgi:hypothetical protein